MLNWSQRNTHLELLNKNSTRDPMKLLPCSRFRRKPVKTWVCRYIHFIFVWFLCIDRLRICVTVGRWCFRSDWNLRQWLAVWTQERPTGPPWTVSRGFRSAYLVGDIGSLLPLLFTVLSSNSPCRFHFILLTYCLKYDGNELLFSSFKFVSFVSLCFPQMIGTNSIKLSLPKRHKC